VAPRAYWKGYLKLSLVSCPIALFPATSEREKISFHQLNKETGNRIRYKKVDAETGDEVDSANIIKGYEVAKGEDLELEPEELDAVAVESKRVIDIDEFVPRNEIDDSRSSQKRSPDSLRWKCRGPKFCARWPYGGRASPTLRCHGAMTCHCISFFREVTGSTKRLN
jgi:Ku70/Ku80 beta-barrel domain